MSRLLSGLVALLGLATVVEAFGDRSYRRFAAGNVVALTGLWIQRIAVGWLTWQLTESGGWLGVMAFADLFPVVIFAPFGGAISDRWDVRKVIVLAAWLSMLQAVSLIALTASGLITVEILLVLTMLKGFFSALDQPARLAVIPLMLERRHLSAGTAVGAISFNGAQFMGPAIAGIIILKAGVAGAFVTTVGAYAYFLLMLRGVRLRAAVAMRPKRPGGLFGDLAEGVRYSAGQPGIPAALMMIAAIALFARPVVELFPGFAAAVFQAGPQGLAILSSAIGLGAVTNGLWLARRDDPAGLVWVIVRSFGIVALALGAFVATETLWVAAPAAFVAGFCISSVGVSTQILLQASVPAEFRGRVMSLYVVLFRAVPAVGALVMGLASEQLGLRIPVAAGAACMLVVFAVARSRHPRMAAALEGPRPAPDRG